MSNDILVNVGADVSGFSRAMSTATGALTNFSKKNKDTFSAFKKTGAVVTGAGALLAAGLGSAVSKAAEFEEGMSKVKAVSGATGDDFDDLTERARELGSVTSFSASEAAEGMSYLALSGWETEEMMSGLEPILHLAEAGALELGEAADLTTDSMSSMGVEVKDLDGYLDKVAATSANANTEVDELMEAYVLAGGTFERLNVPLEESAAFLGILGDKGIKGAKAGTAVNAIMTRLTQSSGPAADALDDMGVSAFDSEGNFRGMETVLKEVEQATGEMTDKQKANAVEMLAGLNHGKSLEKMLSGLGDGYDELKGEVTDSNGALKDMRDIMKDNLMGELENLSSAFDEVMIVMGDALMPAIKALVSGLQGLADWFNGLSDETKTFIAITAGVVAALALIIGPILLLIGFLPLIASGFAVIGTVVAAVFSPVGAIIAGVVAAVAALVAIAAVVVKNWEPISDFFIDLWDGIKDAGIAVWEWLQGVWESTVEAFTDIFGPLIEILSDVWDNIKTIAEESWEIIKNVILAPVLLLIDLLTGDFEAFSEHLSEIWGNISESASKIWQAISDIFSDVWNAIKDTVGNALDWIDGKTGGKFSEMLQLIREYMDMIFGVIKDVWGYVKDSFTNVLSFLKALVTGDFAGMKDAANKQMKNMLKLITNIWDRIKTFFGGVMGDILAEVGRKFTEIVTSVTGKMDDVVQGVKDGWNNAVDFLKGISLSQIGKDIIQGLIDGIASMGKWVSDAISDLAGWIPGWIKKKLGIASPSKVTDKLGVFIGEGLADGISGSAKMVKKASNALTDAAMVDPPELARPTLVRGDVDMSYATPDGVASTTMRSAVRGTVDVNSREDKLVGAIAGLERKLTDLRVEMDGREVGNIVEPHVTGRQVRKGNRSRRSGGGHR